MNGQLQAKRRLELEPSEFKDGGGAPKAMKPMAALPHAGGHAPAPDSIAHTSLFERSRMDTSLGVLTQRFAEMVRRSNDGVLDLNLVAQELRVQKRRVYDVTNVLEGIQLIKKKSKNNIQWLGGSLSPHTSQDLSALIEEEKKLDELIKSCKCQLHQLCGNQNSLRFAYLTYEDVQRIPSLKEQTVIVIKAPAETKLEVPHPEESLQVHLSSTQGPIEVFVCSDDPLPMDTTDSSAANSGNSNSTTTGNGSCLIPPGSSFIQASSKDSAIHTSGISSISSPPPELTKCSSGSVITGSPMLTSPRPPSEDQPSFVTLTPPLALSPDGEEYLLSLTEDEGINDLFSSVDLDVDMPL